MLKSGTLFRSGNLQTCGQRDDAEVLRQRDMLREIYYLEKRGEIGCGIGGDNTRATIGRLCSCEVGPGEHLTEDSGMERKDACVDTESSANHQKSRKQL